MVEPLVMARTPFLPGLNVAEVSEVTLGGGIAGRTMRTSGGVVNAASRTRIRGAAVPFLVDMESVLAGRQPLQVGHDFHPSGFRVNLTVPWTACPGVDCRRAIATSGVSAVLLLPVGACAASFGSPPCLAAGLPISSGVFCVSRFSQAEKVKAAAMSRKAMARGRIICFPQMVEVDYDLLIYLWYMMSNRRQSHHCRHLAGGMRSDGGGEGR